MRPRSPRRLFDVIALLVGMMACARALPSKPSRGLELGAGPIDTGGEEAEGGGAPGPALWIGPALQPALLQAIAGAQDRVWTAQYTLWGGAHTEPVYAALADAARRGVQVRVLADEEADDTPGVLAELRAAGAEAALDSPAVTTHHKLWIIDGQLITGSHNLSDSALSRNEELSAGSQEPAVLAAAEARFASLWADPAARPEATATLDRSAPAQLFFDDEALGALLSCIEAAERRVRVGLYAVAWDDRYPGSAVDRLLSALEAASARGLDVAVLLDDSAWVRENNINDAALARLSAAGVPVRRAERSELVHAKALVCDGEAVVSDANWSYSGLELYHGATLSLRDPAAADAVAGWIDGLYARGSAR